MTKIIVLTNEENDPHAVSIQTAGNVTPNQAFAICSAATRHFQNILMEAEVERRVANRETDHLTFDAVAEHLTFDIERE